MSDKDQVIQALRATLLSVKGALTIEQCNRDYRELQGEWIPYKKLGYSSLDQLFTDVPGFKAYQCNGHWYVDAIASEETAHIANMVAKQRSSKKSIKSSYINRFPKKQGSWRKPSQSAFSYSSNYSNQYYRAKGGTPSYNSVKYTYNSNNYNNNGSKYNEPNERTTMTYPGKPASKPVNQNTRPTVDREFIFLYTYNSNNYNNNGSKYNKPNERTTTTYPGKPASKPVNQNTRPTVEYPGAKPTTDHNEKTANNVPVKTYMPQVLREINTVVDETKHSKRIDTTKAKASEIKTEPKPIGKISASQRLSNLRDRLNTIDSMNSIPLQLPAANNMQSNHHNELESSLPDVLEPSGPVAHIALACTLEPPPDSTSSVVKLEWTCKKLGLPQPVYKVVQFQPKRGPIMYDCNCKVGTSYSATSYPDSSPSEELAREVGAMKLLALIESYDSGNLPTSTSAKAIAGLSALVAEHEAGLMASMVPHTYREKHGENLPSNWQDLVENCPLIVIERVVNGLLVLLPNTEEQAHHPVDLTLCLTLDDTIDSDLPPLQFPSDDFWNVFVTVANSTLEIWLRIIGPQYSDALENLLSDMASYYDRAGTLVDKVMIIKNAWYAVNLEDGGWQRAKILELDDESATVFLGDHGDDDVVDVNKIKILEPQFRKLPAQAILCRLEGAEELSASEEGANLVRKRLPGEALVAAPGPRADPSDPSVALVLYDTSTARDLNLNKEIVHDFCIAGAFTITQKPCDVAVGCVTDEGRVWVVRAAGAAVVSGALALLTEGPYRRPLPAAPAAPPTAPTTLYIVRTLAGEWVRCVIISGVDGEGTVRTQLVDSGLVLRAPLSSLVPLQAFSPALSTYPYQAIQVRLGPAERAASAMAGRLRELLLGARVLCRALPPSAAATPTAGGPNVELFVRTGPQNILASVNNAILMEHDYHNQNKTTPAVKAEPTNHVEALNRRKERIFRSSASNSSIASVVGDPTSGGPPASTGGALPPAALPAPGQCCDVYIAMAANPWNFVVQPNNTRHQLQTMMASLQAECPQLSELEAPTNPVSGELYTVYYDKDSSWYRVLIAGSVSTEMVSVYFCDYGDLALFSNKELRPVPPGAPLARTLPPQAIKAKLYDVWPLHQDWTVEDCIRFQELCVEQQFVGICKDVGKDPLNPSEPLVTLDLIDTSTDEDIYLKKQLVAEGRARLSSTT